MGLFSMGMGLHSQSFSTFQHSNIFQPYLHHGMFQDWCRSAPWQHLPLRTTNFKSPRSVFNAAISSSTSCRKPLGFGNSTTGALHSNTPQNAADDLRWKILLFKMDEKRGYPYDSGNLHDWEKNTQPASQLRKQEDSSCIDVMVIHHH